MNDYVLNICEFNKPILFHIFYDRVKQSYYLRNANTVDDKNPIFCKITNTFKIKKRSFFQIGEFFIKIESDERY